MKDYDIDTGKANKLRQIVNSRFVGGRNLQTLGLLREFCHFQATDPRDKVYAVAPSAVDAERVSTFDPITARQFKKSTVTPLDMWLRRQTTFTS
jgi:hypothetical protein